MPFTNRVEAGRRLAQALEAYRPSRPVVLALPRGGVPVAAEVAKALDAPLDLVLVRKLGVPQEPELAAGAVVDGAHPVIVRNDDVIHLAGISDADLDRIARAELAEIARRRDVYLRGRPHPELKGRTVIVVDDGIATGATARAALRALRKLRPAELILAVPVGPSDALAALRREADRVICLEVHTPFGSIGAYYADFAQLTDAEVIRALDAANAGPAAPHAQPTP